MTWWHTTITRHYDVSSTTQHSTLHTSDSVRSTIRLVLSSVKFSDDLFSSSPSSLKTLTSSVLPKSSPPPPLLTCGILKHSLLFKNKAPIFPYPVCEWGSTRGDGKRISIFRYHCISAVVTAATPWPTRSAIPLSTWLTEPRFAGPRALQSGRRQTGLCCRPISVPLWCWRFYPPAARAVVMAAGSAKTKSGGVIRTSGSSTRGRWGNGSAVRGAQMKNGMLKEYVNKSSAKQ